ncbi:hypothetical protein M7I_6331 [Glarea lozoyensis 74030]|uniref:Small acidic protein n=1 Tax=Glarea lozoyensis (strain ATCC 74030 / MF5533) TaxID=1104152 RepID=H0EU99_GLAL7|nr:hypothetical protein M7I_6331 [Glarea lozoyensis 74030]
MEGADFISFGDISQKQPFDTKREPGLTFDNKTEVERKEIQRAHRLAAKRAHKKEKSDAKKARKENAILHRRATKNREKYNKNKERNAIRDIEAERKKIRRQALDQYKNITGEKFEGLGRPVLPEGKSVPEGEENMFALWDLGDEEIVKRIRGHKAKKREAARKLRRSQMEMKKLNRALKARRKECENRGEVFDVQAVTKEILEAQGKEKDKEAEGEDDGWEDEVEEGEGEKKGKRTAEGDVDGEPSAKKSKMSNGDAREEVGADGKKKKKGPNIPKLNLALLDDATIAARVAKEKKKTRTYLKKIDAVATSLDGVDGNNKPVKKEKKKRKDSNAGDEKPVVEDTEMAETTTPKKEKKESKKKKKDMASEEEKPEVAGEVKPTENTEIAEATTPKESKKKKKSKDAEEEKIVEQDTEVLEPTTSKKDKKKKKDKTSEEDQPTEEAVEVVTPKKDSKKKNKDKSSTKEVSIDPETTSNPESKKKKKDKSSKSDPDAKSSKKRKAEAEPVVAAQWNPEALGGDAERKRGKVATNGEGGKGGEGDKGKTKGEIEKVQSELERQYEMGMKMKHDGGGKRRGLGA